MPTAVPNNAPLPGSVNINRQNPTLVPNVDKPVAINGVMALRSPSGFVKLFPRANASIAVTVGGTANPADVISLIFTSGLFTPFGNPVTVSYTVGGTDDLEAITEGLAAAVNSNATLQSFGVFADAAKDVLTIYWPGPGGNFCTLTNSIVGSTDETLTLNPVSGVLAGGSGPIIPFANFSFSFGGIVTAYWIGKPTNVAYNVLAALIAQGKPIA
jgi:hypothetical protein